MSSRVTLRRYGYVLRRISQSFRAHQTVNTSVPTTVPGIDHSHLLASSDSVEHRIHPGHGILFCLPPFVYLRLIV